MPAARVQGTGGNVGIKGSRPEPGPEEPSEAAETPRWARRRGGAMDRKAIAISTTPCALRRPPPSRYEGCTARALRSGENYLACLIDSDQKRDAATISAVIRGLDRLRGRSRFGAAKARVSIARSALVEIVCGEEDGSPGQARR
jgi:hypothetical protein